MPDWDFAESIFPAGFAGLGGLNKDPTVLLDGARPPPIDFIGLALV